MKYRLYLLVLLVYFTVAFSDISAQYRVLGFEGGDTIELGIAEKRGGKVVLPKNIDKYTTVELVPTSPRYAEVKAHLAALQQAFVDKSTERIAVQQRYIIEQLDFTTLYYSPLYIDYLLNWLSSYSFTATSTFDFEQNLRSDVVATLSRLLIDKRKDIASAVAKDMIIFAYQHRFTLAAGDILRYMRGVESDFVERHKELHYSIDFNQLQTNRAAPKIVGLPDTDLANCLILFFSSSDPQSRRAIEQIAEQYALLQEQGIRIISIAADTDIERYRTYSKQLPWTDKLCDFYGEKGENFAQYGVLYLPSMFLTDAKGNIIKGGADFDKIFAK